MPSNYKPLPSTKYLRECFDYRPETGDLIWRERPSHHFKSATAQKISIRMRSGKTAGYVNQKGYRRVHLDEKQYPCHRVIWRYVHDYDPGELEIDHINGNSLDNRITNLRAVTPRENYLNQRRSIKNTSGRTGVVLLSWGKYEAKITVLGRRRFLGVYDTFEEAAAARHAAERIYGFHPNHGTVRKRGKELLPPTPDASTDVGV